MSSVEIVLHSERPIDAQKVCALYASVEWWPERTAEQIASVLNNDVAIGAWDGERLIGFARIVSDHHFHAYIEDVVIHPDYQRMGLGRQLMTKLLAAIPPAITTITLFCHSDLIPFYEQLGFRAFPSQKIMHQRRDMPRQADQKMQEWEI